MDRFAKYYEAREIIYKLLKEDLIGPVNDKTDEVIVEAPLQYYLMGKLYPRCSQTDEIVDSVAGAVVDAQTNAVDSTISLSNENNPSSMAVTICLKENVKEIQLFGRYAFYKQIPYEESKEYGINPALYGDVGEKKKKIWKRFEFSYDEKVSVKETNKRDLENNISLQVFTHPNYKTEEKIITIALVNKYENKNNDYDFNCEHTAFQVEMEISGIDKTPIFSNVTKLEYLSNDEEIKELEMLYSRNICYAQGHGCSVIWDEEHESPLWIKTSFFPEYNLNMMKSGILNGDLSVLSMKFLAYSSKSAVITALKQIQLQYSSWIQELNPPDERFKEIAKQNIEKCKIAAERIQTAINLLNEDDKAFKAFQLTNEAMLLQQIQKIKIENNVESVDENKISWYLFQLAFMLQELPSFINPESNDRSLVDLLWFPTGGGKTEAYLGISAFVIFLRRLRNPSDDGVTILMRYTLRLLTIQQFERASRMICACEILRNQHKLGGNEISIGLWVGTSLTPNKIQDAYTGLKNHDPEKNPCQIKKCPWCGEELNASAYYVDTNKSVLRMFVRCANGNCAFHKGSGLPVHIIDEQIYKYKPTFIVATVDKFAQLAFNEDTISLFGLEPDDQKTPPELIIQDELHLLSGPLGTMTGIYEAAVTNLCRKNGIYTKVIASTATIRNAKDQIKSLYGRDFMQFPPQAINVDNSFFAVKASSEEKPVRRYCGVMGIGTTPTTTLIRVNSILLLASRYLVDKGFENKIIDNYWTITDYFNSLRELGGASIQIVDDVQSRYAYLKDNKFAYLAMKKLDGEKFDKLLELTSNLTNDQITDYITKKLPSEFTLEDHHDTIDFLLASNMISVGVDVSRLGVMTVLGQPKTNAEYIQATSRVGRSNPGLVVTIYNPNRSRDRSHYEQFFKYHSSLYRYVEATSLTPFADRARDRGLHALFVIMCRYRISKLRRMSDAGNFNKTMPEIQEIKKTILDYIKVVDPEELKASEYQLDEIIKEWDFRAQKDLIYKGYRNENSLLKADIEDDIFRTMNSLRSVDPQSDVFIYR